MTADPPMMIAFEDALDSDADALADLRVSAMRESLERIGRFDPSRARERLLESFEAAATRHLVADGVRVGFFVVRATLSELLLDHLYIDPRYQGRGLGAIVLAEVFSEADRRRVDVRVGALKESASNRFYLRHGFEPVARDEWDIYYVRKHRGTRCVGADADSGGYCAHSAVRSGTLSMTAAQYLLCRLRHNPESRSLASSVSLCIPMR